MNARLWLGMAGDGWGRLKMAGDGVGVVGTGTAGADDRGSLNFQHEWRVDYAPNVGLIWPLSTSMTCRYVILDVFTAYEVL